VSDSCCVVPLALVWSSFDASSQVATGVPPLVALAVVRLTVINLGNLNQTFHCADSSTGRTRNAILVRPDL